jgi:Na+/H+ antiporter NhaD/arsenite permease-like protein
METFITEAVSPRFNAYQTAKGALVLGLLVTAFLFLPVPREAVALAAAGCLLVSRKMASRHILGSVDWQLLVLFMALFVVNHALREAGWADHGLAELASIGVHLEHPAWLFGAIVALSNVVSNVPATMLLLPAATHPQAGPILALAGTFAGNLFIVGSIANIIVIEQARAIGVRVGWLEHARVGAPITLLTLALAAGWLALLALLGVR